MVFVKTGEVPINRIYCSCGQELSKDMKVCPKCNKELISTNKEQKKLYKE